MTPGFGRATAALLLSFLATAPGPACASLDDAPPVLLPPGLGVSPLPEAPRPAEHAFTLRHIYHHGGRRYPELHRRRDVERHGSARVFLAAEDDFPELGLSRLTAKSRPLAVERLADRRPSVVDPLVAESRRTGRAAVLDVSAWTVDQVPAPDVTDKGTVLSLAYMAANAYVQHQGDAQWEDVGAPFNRSADFGWHSDGLRGHIWADQTNSTIVIGLKGTTPAVFDGDGTTTNDKVNDNLFFSCCCGQQGHWTWHQVCDCATDTYSCNNTCVIEALRREDHYYAAARELYSNVTELYPAANIWLTGHSLGGAVTSMLGLTYGLPVVTFEAVPEALAVSRLGLPVPPGSDPRAPQTREHTGAFHFGHTADPIYIGTCNGVAASCSFAGYALETVCHTGRECVWDVVADKGWRVGIGTHKIRAVIRDVILPYHDVPVCTLTPECRDCPLWKMYESNVTTSTTTATATTTTSTSTRRRTRTSTCQTPGWWGCLDEPATTTATATTTTTPTSSTSTCKTPGWFWCKDKTTSTTQLTTTTTTTTTATTTRTSTTAEATMTTTTTSTITTTTTSTCETPGWFWCKDKTTPTPVTTTTSSTRPLATPSPTTCTTPGRFWGCWDQQEVATAPPRAMPGSTTALTPPRMTATPTSPCRHGGWLGPCSDEKGEEAAFSPDEI